MLPSHPSSEQKQVTFSFKKKTISSLTIYNNTGKKNKWAFLLNKASSSQRCEYIYYSFNTVLNVLFITILFTHFLMLHKTTLNNNILFYYFVGLWRHYKSSITFYFKTTDHLIIYLRKNLTPFDAQHTTKRLHFAKSMLLNTDLMWVLIVFFLLMLFFINV